MTNSKLSLPFSLHRDTHTNSDAMQSEADFLNSLLSSMDASHTSQVTSSLPAPPSTSTLPSQPIQASTSRNTQQSTKEVEQLLEGAEDWDWNDDDLEDGNDVGMPDASDAVCHAFWTRFRILYVFIYWLG